MKFLVPTLLVFVVAALVISIAASQGFLYKNTSETTSKQGSKQTVSAQPTPPKKVKNTEQKEVGTLLNARTESLIKEKEPEWTLVLNRSSSRSESSSRRWKYGNKEISVLITSHESVDQAKLTFEKGKSPMSAPVSFEGKDVEGFGDEGAFLRPQDPKSKRVSLLFSLDRFYVHITGETSDVLRFAKHIQDVLRENR